MAQGSLDKIVERWRNDPAFRDELRKDPEGTIRRSGFDLTEDEWATIRGMDWTDESNFDENTRMGVLNPDYDPS